MPAADAETRSIVVERLMAQKEAKKAQKGELSKK